MRPVGLADIERAARVLMLVAPEARQAVMRQMIAQAEIADQFRTANGTPHALFGTGSLMSCAMRRQAAPRPAALGADPLQAYRVVLQVLLAGATDQSR